MKENRKIREKSMNPKDGSMRKKNWQTSIQTDRENKRDTNS